MKKQLLASTVVGLACINVAFAAGAIGDQYKQHYATVHDEKLGLIDAELPATWGEVFFIDHIYVKDGGPFGSLLDETYVWLRAQDGTMRRVYMTRDKKMDPDVVVIKRDNAAPAVVAPAAAK